MLQVLKQHTNFSSSRNSWSAKKDVFKKNIPVIVTFTKTEVGGSKYDWAFYKFHWARNFELQSDVPFYQTPWTLQAAWLLALWHLMWYVFLESHATRVVKHHLCKRMLKHVSCIIKVVFRRALDRLGPSWVASMWRLRTYQGKILFSQTMQIYCKLAK